MTEHMRTYEKGQLLFAQGSPGGDLFFIKEGEIEIFTTFENHDIVLSNMKAGEVIGTLTLMTKEPRMASARAFSKTTVQHVPQQVVMKAVQGIPKWMLIVLKDFTARLKTMNDRYVQVSNKIINALENPISCLYTAAQLACTIAECADSKKIKFDDMGDGVPKTIIDYVTPMIFVDAQEVNDIFDIFIKSGLLKVQIDKAKGLQYFFLKNATDLRSFGEFFKDCQRKKIVGILTNSFGEKELVMLEALIKYTEIKKLDLTHAVKLNVIEFSSDFQSTTAVPFVKETLTNAEVLKIVRLEGIADAQSLSFDEKTLRTGIAQVKAFHLIMELEKTKVNAGSKTPTAEEAKSA